MVSDVLEEINQTGKDVNGLSEFLSAFVGTRSQKMSVDDTLDLSEMFMANDE